MLCFYCLKTDRFISNFCLSQPIISKLVSNEFRRFVKVDMICLMTNKSKMLLLLLSALLCRACSLFISIIYFLYTSYRTTTHIHVGKVVIKMPKCRNNCLLTGRELQTSFLRNPIEVIVNTCKYLISALLAFKPINIILTETCNSNQRIITVTS